MQMCLSDALRSESIVKNINVAIWLLHCVLCCFGWNIQDSHIQKVTVY